MTDDVADACLPAFEALHVTRCRADGTGTDADDVVVSEVPVAITFNGLSHAVMMATPTDLEAMALGFALSEGLIASPAQCYGIDVTAGRLGCEVALEVAQQAFVQLKHKRRSMEGRSGCGLCGVDSLAALDLQPEPLPARPPVPVAAVLQAMAQLADHQPVNRATGGCHAAGWATPDGALQFAMEDVGRHNALDKLIGRLAQRRLLGTAGFVVMSSRASYELVRKCARVGIGTLATVSAPSTLAVAIAQQAGLVLYGFSRGQQAVRYAGVAGGAGSAPG
ncbi:formate dehydrogenase accessory sulfurtransferase FdhD [Aquincola sp. J276]|uniref:formate dehydrogenase accessory sulfurtransferase FdhD n=1 Tax=Aquincola sp. J276 TaxID=2898432 RepID=UPI00215105CA|nr:formate dehydrogenase accessory sulfurtransferase FdhD [Aquincola sp. J276]MCR5868810.1 formate dehydrogenase accessory sulfurtransferase FdhD [Aquincola sp. J276]